MGDDEGVVFYAGAANILDWPEYYDIDVTRYVLSLFDEFPMLQDIIGRAQGTDPVHILFGDEMEFENLKPTGFVFTRFDFAPDQSGLIGVVGPARMNFQVILPYVKYVRDMIIETGRI